MQRGLAGHRVAVRMARALRSIEARGGGTRWRPPERILERGRNPVDTRPVDDVGNYPLPLPPSSYLYALPFPHFISFSLFLFSKSFHLHSSFYWSFFVFSVRGLATFGIGPSCVSQTVVYTWRLHRQNLYKAMRMHKNQHGRSARDRTHHESRTPGTCLRLLYQIALLIRLSPQ